MCDVTVYGGTHAPIEGQPAVYVTGWHGSDTAARQFRMSKRGGKSFVRVYDAKTYKQTLLTSVFSVERREIITSASVNRVNSTRYRQLYIDSKTFNLTNNKPILCITDLVMDHSDLVTKTPDEDTSRYDPTQPEIRYSSSSSDSDTFADPSQARGREEETVVDQEVCGLSLCDDSTAGVQSEGTRGRKRKQVLTPREEAIAPYKTKKTRQIPTSFVSMYEFLMTHCPFILVHLYPIAWTKYRTNSEKLTGIIRQSIMMVLQTWNNIYTKHPGVIYLQDFLISDPENSLSMKHIGIATRKSVRAFLEEFATEPASEIRPSSIETTRGSLSQTTKSRASATCTSSTTADGRTVPADVQDSGPSAGSCLFDDADVSKDFRVMTSSALRSISYRSQNGHCMLRSKDDAGEYLLKMELYRWQDIRAKEPREWWTCAQWRSQTFMNERSEEMKSVLEACKKVKDRYLSRPDVEKEFRPKKY